VHKSISHSKIESGLLGLEQLHNLLCSEQLRIEFNIQLSDIHNFYTSAIRSGETSWFVRWVTDRLIRFCSSGDVRGEEFTHAALETLKPVVEQLQRITVLEQVFIQNKELLQAEVERFRELADLLQRSFNLVNESLRLNPDARAEIEEVVIAIHEIDIAGGERVRAVREHSFLLRDRAPTSLSFRIVSTAAIEQLNQWHHPLRLEIALRTILGALPKLEDTVFRSMKVDAWGPVLVRHGMEDSAAKLAAALIERRTGSAGSLARQTLTPLPQNSLYLYQASDRTPRQPGTNVSEDESDCPSSGMHTPRQSDFVWYPNDSDHWPKDYTNNSTPAPGPDFAQLFQPELRQADGQFPPRTKVHKPFSFFGAMRRGVFVSRLEGGTPVATPSTVATQSTFASSDSSAYSTPIAKGPRVPRVFGKSKSTFQKFEETREDVDVSGDGKMSAAEEVSVDEGYSSHGDPSDDEEMSGYEETSGGGSVRDDETTSDGGMSGHEEPSNDEQMSDESEQDAVRARY
jgi:hypothetical protein